MILYNNALKILRKTLRNKELKTEIIDLSNIKKRVASAKIIAPIDIQPFDNSAMDGFALYANDVKAASEDNPISLSQRLHIAAGDSPDRTPLPHGYCDKIMTGAPMPTGADMVIPIEMTKRDGDNIIFTNPSKAGKYIRCKGEDFKKDDAIIEKGTVFGLRHILPLATLGIGKIEVYKKPRIAIFSTGDELIRDFEKPLNLGQIYDSNRPNMLNFIKEIGAECVIEGVIPDNAKAFAKQLEELKELNLDAIITSGAVSKGTHDFIPTSLKIAGAKTHFHKAKVRPGKPTLFAEFDNGTAYFGLAGNPMATAMGLRFFFYPWLESRYNIEPETPIRLEYQGEEREKPPFQFFYKAALQNESDKTTKINIIEGQQSFKTSPLLKMTGWAAISEKCNTIKTADILDFYPIIPHIFAL